jgi:Flp pilus assembly protein TadG
VLPRALRREDGQALVELALVLPVLLLVVFGIVDFGRAMNYDEQATHLANEAARYAAVGQVPAGATGTLGQWSRAQVDSPELAHGSRSVTGTPTVCVSYPSGTSNVGDPVRISMSYTYSWLPVLHLGVTSTTITRSATMRIENPPTGSFYASGCS